jgi:phosphoglycolate phosphatase
MLNYERSEMTLVAKICVKTLIFDMDGVIVDSRMDIISAVKYTMRQFGLDEISDENIVDNLGKGPKDLIYEAFGDAGFLVKEKGLELYKKYYYNNCTKDTVLYKNVKKVLEYFRDKEVAMVTNKLIEPTKRILNKLEATDYFSIVIGSDSVKVAKPEPDGIKKVLEELKRSPKDAIMIGDSIYDIEAGKAAGVNTCAVTYGFNERRELEKMKPDFLIDDIIELKNFIN